MKQFLLILILLFAFPRQNMAQSYPMHNLSVEHGLSNNYVKDIKQDGQGFIWIATESGLNRFDGRAFTSYTVGNSGLQDDAINSLVYDPYDNLLWIGTKTILSVYNCLTEEITNFNGSSEYPIRGVVHVELAGDSAIWIVNHYDGIVKYNKRTQAYTHYSAKTVKGLKNNNWCTLDNGKGVLYVGHAQNGFSIVDTSTRTTRHFRHEPGNPHSLPGNSVYSIFIDSQNNIWLGTNQGLALFNQRKGTFLTFKHEPGNPHSLIADHIYDIKEMSDGTLWIASDMGGISILDLYTISFADPRLVRFTNLSATSHENDISSGNIRSLLQDSYGNLWIGNYSSGIDFISHTPPRFQILPYTLAKANRYKNKPASGIYADDHNRVWVGSENEVALFENNKLVRTIDISPYQSRPYAQVFSMRGDKNGIILLGLYDDGLLELNTHTGKIKRIDLGMDNVDVITFTPGPDGRMWIGGEYGIYTYYNGKAVFEKKISDRLNDKSTYGIVFDRQGKMWVGSYGGGILIFDAEYKVVERLTRSNVLPSSSINHMIQDADGGIWIATRNGVAYIKDTAKPKECEWYGTAQGLTDPFVRAIQQDALGNIWVSTNKEVHLWDKQKQRFNNYNRVDGIPSGNFIEGSACLSTDGTVYFGSLNGVCYFNPPDIIAQQPIAPVQIIDCKGFRKQVESSNAEFLVPMVDGRVSLKHDQNSLRIAFSVPDYSLSRQVEYAYMVEGLEEAWSNTLGENHVTFRNLSPGNYRFKVKARLKNQEWDEGHIATMRIHIRPPLWLTWYAKLLYLALVGFVIYIIARAYRNKLKLKSILEIERRNSLNEQSLNQERLRFYTNITHELRTPLTLILGPLEDLTHDRNLPASYSKIIQTIHGSALRLLNLINQILEFRKTETQNRRLTVAKGDIASLVTEIGLRYKELNQNPELTIGIEVKTDRTELFFDAEIVTTILNNLLSNAVKYTPEGEIALILESIEEDGQAYTQIRVSDTGYGIEPEALLHIFDRYYQAKGKHQASGTGIGLALTKSLATIHNASLDVESTVGRGTTFTFRLLTDLTYPDALHKQHEETETVEVILDDPEGESGDTTRPLLLIVEDNDDIRQYIISSLQADYKILEGKNGKEGLHLAQTHIPDLIVSDVMMPEMDGIEFCRIIKEDMNTSHIPVILLTAKDSIQDKEEGYESGADSYITKPFSARLLRTRIQNLLDVRRKLARQITSDVPEEEEPGDEALIRMGKLDEEFLENLTRLVEENLSTESLDITFLTQQLNMSSSTFYRKMKALTGVSANEFIRKIKLRTSKRLLLTGDYNISEAAYMTGFNNMSYFRKVFKKEYGMNPSEFLRKG